MTPRQINLAVVALVLVGFASSLSSTVVSSALPVIVGELDGTSDQYAWVITSTLLTTTATIPIWGKLADLFSKKLLLQIAITVFVVASILSGTSTSMVQLIGWRTVSGFGLGGVQALAMIALAAMVSARERGRFAGWFGAGGALAIVGGPLIGGVVVDILGWRAVFFVVIPIAVVAMVMLHITMRIPVVKRDAKIDYFGSLLLASGVSVLLIWVTLGGKSIDWLSAPSLWMSLGGVVLLGLAVFVESRVQDPIVPLGLLRQRTPVLATIASLAAGVALFGGAVFFGQYYQVGRGYSPTVAGLFTIPMMAGVFFASLLSGRQVTKTGNWKRVLIAGSLSLLVGFIALSFIGESTPMAYVVLGTTFVGVGMGMTQQNLVVAVQNSVPESEVGVATSVTTFFRMLGGTIGMAALAAVLSLLVANRVTEGLAEAGLPEDEVGAAGILNLDAMSETAAGIVRAAYANSMGTIFIAAAGLALIGLIAVLLIREVPLRTTMDDIDVVLDEETTGV